MNRKQQPAFQGVLAVLIPAMLTAALPAFAQYGAPPLQGTAQLDNLVNRIALYPDPLLAQVLAAATYPDQIQDAARFAADNRSLQGDALADVMAQANLPFDPSVQSLIPFPDVLDMLVRDMNWTAALGNAVLDQRPDVMDAVQRMRRLAQSYGYLQSNRQAQVIVDPGYVSIMPVNPTCIYVPYYDPFVVFAPPRPGFFIGGAIFFRSGFVLGARFNSWGWGGGFNWAAHRVVVNHVDWNRDWSNRTGYAAGYRNWNAGRREVTINRSITVNRYAPETRNASRQPQPVQSNGFVPNRGFERRQAQTPAGPMTRTMETRPQGRPAPQESHESHDRGGRRDR
jgi:hypothetical protein